MRTVGLVESGAPCVRASCIMHGVSCGACGPEGLTGCGACLRSAVATHQAASARPTLVCPRSHIAWPAGVSPACIVPPIGGLLAVGRWGGWLDSTRSCASVCEPPWWQPPVSSRDVAELKRCLPHSTPLWGALIQRALWRSTRWRCMPQRGFLHCCIAGGWLLPLRRQLLHQMRDGASRYVRL